MKIRVVLSLFASLCLNQAVAQTAEGDLVLKEARWLAEFTGYVCEDTQPAKGEPALFQSMNLKFENLYTDYTLDNVLVTATYQENGAQCRYSVLLFADNDAKTIRLVESRAFSPAFGSTCAVGKATLDQLLTSTEYMYYGHPHHAAILMRADDARALCGPGADLVAFDFVGKGKIGQ